MKISKLIPLIPTLAQALWEDFKEQRRLRQILNEQGLQKYLEERDKKKSCGHYPCKGVCKGSECLDIFGATIICNQKPQDEPNFTRN